MCGLEIELEDDKILSIRGDEKDVHSKGYICPKALALRDLREDPDRLRRPVRRQGDQWIEISWEEAFSEIEKQIRKIQRIHGRDAVGVYSGNPTVHNTGTLLHLYDFFDALGTRNRFASHSLDQLPLMMVCGDLFGHLAMFPVPDLDRTQYLLILGANPMVSNGSLMSTPGVTSRLRALQQRGGKLVVVDPMKTKTAEAADEHLFIKPGSDVFFLLALIHVIVNEKLIKPGRLANFTDNLDEIAQRSAAWTPEWAEKQSGIDRETIRRIAREFSAAECAVVYGRLGVSVQQHGSLCQWAIIVLNILSGNLDRPGGSLFALPAIDFLSLLVSESKSRRWKSRVRGLPETGGDLPAAALAEEISTPGPGKIRALFTIAGNPARSVPDGKSLEKSLSELEFMVSIDLYRNETTRFANIILPPLTGIDVLHYGLALHIVAPHQSAKFSEPAFPKPEGALYDHEILRELEGRLSKYSVKHQILKRTGPELRLDLALRLGPFGVWGGRLARKNGLSLKKLRNNPHGIDLGELKPQLPGRLFHKNKRIPLLPPAIRQALDGLTETLRSDEYPFLLIGRRHLRSNNSWMHNLKSLQGGRARCTVIINPDDAEIMGIQPGDLVSVRSATGTVSLCAELDDAVRTGVISIPHGWGHDSQPMMQLQLAVTAPGVSVNTITNNQITDPVSGNAVFNGIPVQINRENN